METFQEIKAKIDKVKAMIAKAESNKLTTTTTTSNEVEDTTTTSTTNA